MQISMPERLKSRKFGLTLGTILATAFGGQAGLDIPPEYIPMIGKGVMAYVFAQAFVDVAKELKPAIMAWLESQSSNKSVHTNNFKEKE